MQKTNILKDNYWIFNADIEAYGNKFYQKNKYIKGYAFLAKNINSEEGVITDNDYFNLDIVDFIYQLLDIDTDLKLNNRLPFFKKVMWKKSVIRKSKNNEKRTRKYTFYRDIYFHNGGKYDLHFFLPVIKKIELIDKRIKIENLFFMKKNEILNFSISFTDKNGLKRVLNFKDSYKIFPVPLRMIGESVDLKKLDYEEYDFLDEFKSNLDYFRHNKGNSIKYFIRDVDILNRFFKKIDNFFGLDKLKLTIASTAYKEWEKTVKVDIFKYKNSAYWTEPRFQVPTNFYPQQWLYSKLGYKGGWTYVSPMYQFKEIWKIYKYDVNSLYPSVMWKNKFPYGKVYNGDKYGTTYKELQVDIYDAKLIPTFLPFLPKKNTDYIDLDIVDDDFNGESEYPEKISNKTYFMNNYDFEWFKKSYIGKWKVTVIQSMFERKSPFVEYINYWMGIKEEASKKDDKAIKLFAKLMLNSLYGKFGQKIDVDIIKAYNLTNEEAKERFKITDKSIRFVEESGRERNVIKNGNTYIYATRENQIDITKARQIAIASKITALARQITLEAAHNNYYNFVYADTDSIHLTEPAYGINIDDTKLGCWKFEGLVERAIYRRPKHYLNYGIDDNKKSCKLWKLTGGGFNVREINSDKFITKMKEFAEKYFYQREFTIPNGKIISNIVDGGVLISNTDYKFTLPKWF